MTAKKLDPARILSGILPILQKTYPNPTCALTHTDPLQLLVATILSAQCTDERVNLVTPALFRKYRSAEAFAQATQETLEGEIRSTGFFRNKAKNIRACAQALVADHDGKVPASIEMLVKLPGVGRKTANVILGTAFGIAAGVVVDTHVTRLSQRMGLSTHTDPEKIEADLMKLLPARHWIEFSHVLILHGRRRCSARKPDCPLCEVRAICPRIGLPS
jgi:endonuclease-3